MKVQIESVSAELLKSAELMRLAFGLLARAQTMGFCPASLAAGATLDDAALAELAGCLQQAGVAEEPAARLRAAVAAGAAPRVLTPELRALVEALDASPLPAGEWGPARELLGDDLLARLVGGVSPSSLRRYAGGARETPDDVAWRLHVVARIAAALLGSYNDYGVRRWFERRRTALGGRAPADALAAAGDEDDELLLATIALADGLAGAGLPA